MKKYLKFIPLLIFSECQSQNVSNDYNFTYHHISYVDNKVFDEYVYDSKMKIYISREMKDFAHNEIEEEKISVELSNEELKEIHKLYTLLKTLNPDKCIINKSNGQILSKSSVKFYSDQNNWKNETCNIDIENQKFTNLWAKINEKITSKPEYKKAFKFIGK